MYYPPNISEEKKQQIIQLFNRRTLRPGETTIDNRSITIANETGIPKCSVDRIIALHLDEKFERINKRRYFDLKE